MRGDSFSIPRDESDWQGDEWQSDKDVTRCPLCGRPFTHTFRKHHCRQCGRIVCDVCSPQRLRIPKLPKEGKVRVCTPCVAALGELQATEIEEDLAAYEESISQLRNADRDHFAKCEIFKRVLLDMDAVATGSTSLVEEHLLDPETDLASFAILKDRVQRHWAGLLEDVMTERVRHQELLDGQKVSRERIDQAKPAIEELKSKKAVLMTELREVDKVAAEIDKLTRREKELDKAITDARKRVQELELERRAQQERSQQQQERWSLGRLSRPSSQSPEQLDRAFTEPEAFTITPGRGDPNGRGDRLEGCRRSVGGRCVVM